MCIGLGHLDDTAGANPRASWPPHDDNMTFGKQKRAISDFSPRQLLSSDSSLYFIFGLFVFSLSSKTVFTLLAKCLLPWAIMGLSRFQSRHKAKKSLGERSLS